jgi:hypothetical protein
MGVMIRSQDNLFLITSDRVAGDLPSKSAPKRRAVEVYQVWTGDKWSTNASEAKTFNTEDEADEYVKKNSHRIMEFG